jgi:CO dehydrogenase/acetyl-CoA synthase delta subunit
VSPPRLDQPFVVGSFTTSVGTVPQVSAELTAADFWGTVKVRWGVGRMNYKVDPGLYALGRPDDKSAVLVSANYKLSFDSLRSELKGRNFWILVLDTDGVNVWCAAGKGTFSTDELVRCIEASGLEKLVSHRKLIVPQLGAPGVAAHEVKRLSGFKVTYGPVRSEDLPAFIDAGFKATPEMREKTFTARERLVLVPVELVPALKTAAIILPVLILLSGLGGSNGYWNNIMSHGLLAAAALFTGVLSGSVLTPILLPWLPGRAFSTKGIVLGLLVGLVLILVWNANSTQPLISLENFAWLFVITALASYLAMNFTGASTYTSLSGVKKEMRWAVPVQIAIAVAGLLLWSWSLYIA